MKQFFGKKSRSMLATVIMLSLLLHILAIIVFGTIKFVEAMREEEKVFDAVPVETPPQKEPEYTVNIQQRNKSTPPPRPPAIVVNNPSELDIPALDINVNVESSAVFGRDGGSFGGGGLAGVREMAITANLFGASVTAEKLGVILDISFSTHSVLSSVIEEIQKSFPDALIMFVPGCSISARKSEIVPISAYTETSRKYDKAKFTTTNFINALLTRKDFKKLWDRASQEGTGKIIFSEVNNHHGVAGSDLAMRYLADQGADVIYWFADFDDRLNSELSSKIATHLTRKGVKLMMHDFMGSLGKSHNVETLKMMAERTEGKFFLKFLN